MNLNQLVRVSGLLFFLGGEGGRIGKRKMQVFFGVKLLIGGREGAMNNERNV